MALVGHIRAHAPQPTHFSGTITGVISNDPEEDTIITASYRHAARQRSHSLFRASRQSAKITSAEPMKIPFFALVLNRVILPVGQTVLQRLHVSRQYPFTKVTSGVIHEIRSP
jgi:hypothetical protein